MASFFFSRKANHFLWVFGKDPSASFLFIIIIILIRGVCRAMQYFVSSSV